VGIERRRESSEQGLIDAPSGNVRYKLSDEPTAWGGRAIIGKVIAVSIAGADAVELRVEARASMAGAVRLEVKDEQS
jgi:hypothetical protein